MVSCAAVDQRVKRRVQAFCQGQNLGAGGIHFRRAWNYGGPAKEAVEQQIANIKAFVEERVHE